MLKLINVNYIAITTLCTCIITLSCLLVLPSLTAIDYNHQKFLSEKVKVLDESEKFSQITKFKFILFVCFQN